MSGVEHDVDVTIVGGGLVGSALANALARLPIDTLIIETHDPALLEQPSFDARATALANGSQRVLETLGLWERIGHDAEAIRSIHVSEKGRFGITRIAAAEEGVEALGYTVDNRVLGEALWSRLETAERFRCLAPAKLEDFDVDARGVTARVAMHDGLVRVRSRLLVAADGTRSPVRAALGIRAHEDDYEHCAVVLNCATEMPLEGRAFERFTPGGPLAVLPLTRGRAGIVWTLAPQAAEQALAYSQSQALAALQDAFGYRLGAITRIGERSAYPLSRVRSDSVVADRVVLIGNAAVSLHPVAGQGFNLALRDVATLAEVIATALTRRTGPADVGAREILDEYRDWRIRDQRIVAAFTHGLIKLFGLATPGAGTARGLALAAFDLLPGAKALLARHTMGRAGRMPRLARGLGLG